MRGIITVILMVIMVGCSNALIEEDDTEQPIYVTASHIPKEEVENETGYIFLYEEEGTDRSFYYKPNHTYIAYPVGTEVKLSETLEGKVTFSEEGMFKVEVEDSTKVYRGMSGNVVTDKLTGEELGFISALDTDLTVIVYTYK